MGRCSMNTPSLSSMLPREMMELRSRPLFAFQLDVEKASVIGATPGCDRRVGVIAGGRFEGERLRGRPVPGGREGPPGGTGGACAPEARVAVFRDCVRKIWLAQSDRRDRPRPSIIERAGLPGVRDSLRVVPQEGFEPPTPALRMRCSTN